ncbi:MAG: MATE family efflux transporter [Betaproteobacteria bacterium]|nr:MATE family efflux transporter [Betaproteobacteria bacterium]
MSGARTQKLLDGPILPTLAGLAAPGLVLAVMQTAVSIADTHYVGRLGTEALAGLALVFPLVMLLQMTSAGAMGGGVSSAVARSLGAGKPQAARGLVAHALVIALCAGLLFTLLLVGLGHALYALLGGKGETLRHALAYSDILFAGAVLVWLGNTLASVLRGSGNTLVPAVAWISAGVMQIPLSGALTLGWGPFPRLEIAGAAIAYISAAGFATLAMALYVWVGPLRPLHADWKLEWRVFREILRVGLLSSVSVLQTVFTAVMVTGFVGAFGTAALAGYGVGLRLELLQIPIVFAIGQSMVVLVGTNVGAGQGARAKRIAWIGSGIAASFCAVIGLTTSLYPAGWIGLFSQDPAVMETGSLYLRIAAPFYFFFGLGVALYFASQGSGKVMLPVLAGTARLVAVVAGGVLAVNVFGSIAGLFGAIAVGLLLLGTITAWSVYRTPWGKT